MIDPLQGGGDRTLCVWSSSNKSEGSGYVLYDSLECVLQGMYVWGTWLQLLYVNTPWMLCIIWYVHVSITSAHEK